MKSALYTGTIQHRRAGPARNAFRYRIFMSYLDLAELPQVFERRWLWSVRRPALAWFRRADFLGPADVPLTRPCAISSSRVPAHARRAPSAC